MDKKPYIIKPSTFAYDGMNTIDEIMGEYDGFLSILSDNDLIDEFKLRSKEFVSDMTVINVRMYNKARSKMLEKGLDVPSITGTQLGENQLQ